VVEALAALAQVTLMATAALAALGWRTLFLVARCTTLVAVAETAKKPHLEAAQVVLELAETVLPTLGLQLPAQPIAAVAAVETNTTLQLVAPVAQALL
jgi:hypothetical protein